MSFADLSGDTLCQILLEALKNPAPLPVLQPFATGDPVWVEVKEKVGRGRSFSVAAQWAEGTIAEQPIEDGAAGRVLVNITTHDPRPWYMKERTDHPPADSQSWFEFDSEKLQRRNPLLNASIEERRWQGTRREPATPKEVQQKRLQGVSTLLARVQVAAKAFEPKIVDEVARCIMSESVRWYHGGWNHVADGGKIPRRRYKGQRLTMLLHELEIGGMAALHRPSPSWPLQFTKLRAPAVSRGTNVVRWGTDLIGNVEMLTAICDQAQMRTGVHHVEVVQRRSGSWSEAGAAIGVVRAGTSHSLMQGPSRSITQRTSESKNAWGWNNVAARPDDDSKGSWSYARSQERSSFAPETAFSGWQGWVGGDTLGLTLDVDQGTLTAYKNRKLVGVIATDLPVGGRFCWYVDLRHSGQELSIAWAPTPRAAAPAQAGAVAGAAFGKKQKV